MHCGVFTGVEMKEDKKRVAMVLDADDAESLRRIAFDTKRPVSQIVRELIHNYVAKHKKDSTCTQR